MKDKRIVVLAGLLAAYFALNGVVKLASHPHVVGNFDAWGYPRPFLYAVGAVELAAGGALVVGRAARAGAAVLLGVMVGALGTHLAHGEWAHALIPTAVMPLLALVGRRRRPPPGAADATGPLRFVTAAWARAARPPRAAA